MAEPILVRISLSRRYFSNPPQVLHNIKKNCHEWGVEVQFLCVLSMAMYIRVKRSKTTYFIRCDPTETILDIKEKLHVLIDQPVNNQRLILVGTGEILEDSKSLADQKVENDAVVALTLRKDDNEFEDVNIVRPNEFYQSRDGDW